MSKKGKRQDWGQPSEHKIVDGLLTDVDEDQGIITAIFAVMGNVDLGGDRIISGAFKKTFMENGLRVLVLDQHRVESTTDAIAKPIAFRELSQEQLPSELLFKYPDATGAAEAVLQFEPDKNKDEKSSAVFFRLKQDWVNQWSFGYDAVDKEFTEETIDGKSVSVRNLKSLRLYEVSPCLWGMNPATRTTGAKAVETKQEEKPYNIFEDDGEYCVYRVDEDGAQMGDSLGCHPSREEADEQVQTILISEAEEEQGKGATGKAGLPLASREREWDASAAKGRIRSWAGGEDDMDWPKYRQAFFWYNSDASDQFGSYKLPFADVISGELQAVPRGLFAVAGVLQGARGGTDIPASDISSIKSKVNSYYASMRSEFDDDSIIPPWDKSFLAICDGCVKQLYGEMEQYSFPLLQLEKCLFCEAETKSWYCGEIFGKDATTTSQNKAFVTWEMIDSLMRKYYRENGIKEPTDETVKAAMLYAFKEYTPQGPIQRLGDVLQGNIHKVFSQIADSLYIKGMLSTEERIALSNAIGDALEVLETSMPLGVAEREVYYYYDDYCYGHGYMSNDPEIEEKIGRVLSSRNASRIVGALTAIIEVLEAAGIDIPGYGEEEEEEKLNNELAEKLEAGPVLPSTLLDDIRRESLEIEREMLRLEMEE